MKSLCQTLRIILVLFLFASCDKFNTSDEKFEQNVLFQSEYINYAWGYVNSGWIIDSTGNVHVYNLPESWNNCDSLGFISDTAINYNISVTDSICMHIDKKDLLDKVSLIKRAAKGSYSDPEQEMCDAGIVSYYGYIYNKKTKKYQRILLRQRGDIKIVNESGSAEQLYDWLKSVEQKINK
ncbi:MAG: hypothetical protein WCR82_03440 [Bacteroidales bacterium]|jgi:hypothetical protein